MAHPLYWREWRRYLAAWGAAPGAAWRHALAAVPTDCPLCGARAAGGQLCPGCRGQVLRSMQEGGRRCPRCGLALGPAPACPDCAALRPAFDGIVAAFDYAASGEQLIHQLKAQRRFHHGRMLAALIADAVRTASPGLPENTILVCVPASHAALLRRGFNPAAEIARHLAAQLQWPYRPGLLARRGEGASQKLLTRAQRYRQAARLYRCTARLDGASVAVVDDVLTTGSTLHGIARELKAAGAASVHGLVAARTPYK